MATSGMERLLGDWAGAWSSHDAEQILSLFTDDCVYEDVPLGIVSRGKEELRAFAAATFAGIPDIRQELTAGFVAGTSAGIEWVMSGTHAGDFPGMPATGKRFSVRGASILVLRDGLIQRIADYWDAATVMRQVGLLSPQ